MRPRELIIKGFRSFAERTVIDWRGRRLVGIVGPIGSGKSSILDAIVFALYGKTPVFQTESKTLIRQGAESARVELAFEAAGTAWRVIRVLRHAGAGRHVLYRDTGEALSVPECEKEREVTAKIEDILGLDFPTFCRSVLLAQNRFAEFLTASPGDRDKVLKGVFGFDRLDGMQALARERRTRAALEQKELEGRLASAAEDEERLGEIRPSLERAAERLRRFENAAPEVRAQTERESEARRQAANARTRSAELDELARQLPPGEELEAELSAVEDAVAELERREDEAREAQEALAEARRHLDATLAEVGSAENHARAESRLEALRQTEARVKRLAERRRAVLLDQDRRRAEKESAGRALEKATEAEAEAKRAAQEASRTLDRAREDLATAEKSAGDRAALTRAREGLQNLRLARTELEREHESHRRVQKRLEDADTERDRADAEHRRATAAESEAEIHRGQATAALAHAEDALHQAEHAEMALSLARELRLGEPCPVCEQPVRSVQAKLPSENLDQARAAYDAVRDAVRDAGERLLERSKEAAQWRQKVKSTERAQEMARTELEEAAARRAERQQACEKIASELVEILGEGDPELRLTQAQERLARVEAAVKTSEDAERRAALKLRDDTHALELARQQDEAAAGALMTLEKQLADLDAEVREVEETHREARREVAALLGEGDFEALLDRARRRLGDAEAELRQIRARTESATGRAEEGRREVEAARRAQERLMSRLAGLAGQLGYVDETGGEALLPRALAREIRQRLCDAQKSARDAQSQATREESTAREARRHLFRELELDDDADFDTDLASTRASYQHLNAAVTELEKRLQAAAELREAKKKVEARHQLYVRLTDDLQASKFLRYLLEQERAALADLGSERFEMLSEGRYRFTDDGTFQVIDQTNADAVRKADTLSGGETFLASLALALALAEKVTAGGGRLEAFFLDEGFGSLDSEHLTLAMEGIERLVTDTANRLVTVVSHVPEMRERVEDLIELDKDPLTGSTIVKRGATAAS